MKANVCRNSKFWVNRTECYRKDALPRAREPPYQHFMRSNDTTNVFGKKLGELTEKSHYAKPITAAGLAQSV